MAGHVERAIATLVAAAEVALDFFDRRVPLPNPGPARVEQPGMKFCDELGGVFRILAPGGIAFVGITPPAPAVNANSTVRLSPAFDPLPLEALWEARCANRCSPAILFEEASRGLAIEARNRSRAVVRRRKSSADPPISGCARFAHRPLHLGGAPTSAEGRRVYAARLRRLGQLAEAWS